jgi:hypothetical protein
MEKGEGKKSKIRKEKEEEEGVSKYFNVIPGGQNNSEEEAERRMDDVCRLMANLFFPFHNLELSDFKSGDRCYSLVLEFTSVKSKISPSRY